MTVSDDIDGPESEPPIPGAMDIRAPLSDRISRYLDVHAPRSWIDGRVFERERTAECLTNLLSREAGGDLLPMLVLCADIRKSTLVMRESNDLDMFADTLSSFMVKAESLVRNAEGWFDKFTGDGFLAYWLPRAIDEDDRFPPYEGYESEDPSMPDPSEHWMLTAVGLAAGVASQLLSYFQRQTLPEFIAAAGNFIPDVGLAWGIDGGSAQLVEMAGDLTIVGKPVVGSVRMVSCAHSWEAVSNVFVGELLMRTADKFLPSEINSVKVELSETKEYDEQLVYPLEFAHFRPPVRPPARSK